MKYPAIFILLFLTLVLLGSCNRSMAMEIKAQQKFSSPDWRVRKQGVNLLVQVQGKSRSFGKKNNSILLNALSEEVKRKTVFKEKGKSGHKSTRQIEEEFDKAYPRQDYGDYVVALANLIAEEKIKGGLPVLFEFLVDTDYVVSPVLPVYYGDSAFEYLKEKASIGYPGERKQAIQILSLWVNPPKEAEDWDPSVISALTEEQKERALPILLNALKEQDSYVVYCAMTGLEIYLDRPEVKEKIIQLSNAPDDSIRNGAKKILKSTE